MEGGSNAVRGGAGWGWMGGGYCLMCDVGGLQQLANLYVRRDQTGRRYSRVEEGVGGDTTEGEREGERAHSGSWMDARG